MGLYGVRGWVRVASYTRPPEQIFSYHEWLVDAPAGRAKLKCPEGRRQGKSLVARLEGVEDRERARELLGSEISVSRSQFASPGAGEYYWIDLVGLEVVNLQGASFGKVSRLMETGANDVLVVQGDRERLLPWIPDVVRRVDLEGGVIEVDWDAGF